MCKKKKSLQCSRFVATGTCSSKIATPFLGLNMFHVYKLGRVGCQALANDFKNFRSNEKTVEEESYVYAAECETRWSDDVGGESSQSSDESVCFATDASILYSTYQSGLIKMELIHLLYILHTRVIVTGQINRMNPRYLKKNAL